MLREVAALLVSGFLSLGGAARSAPPSPQIPSEEQPPQFEGEIDVSLSTIVVRAADTWGAPILNLRPEDFWVRAGKRETGGAALDWVAGGEPAPAVSPAPQAAVSAPEAEEVAAPAPPPAGR